LSMIQILMQRAGMLRAAPPQRKSGTNRYVKFVPLSGKSDYSP
jgi:hypothetical protein